ESSAGKPSPPAPAYAAPVNLLPLIDVKRDGVIGQWRLRDERRVEGRPATKEVLYCLVLPWDPPPEYRLKLTATRLTDDPGQMGIGLANGPARFNILFDVADKGKLFTGLASDRREAWVGRVLPRGLPINLACTVWTGKVRVEA